MGKVRKVLMLVENNPVPNDPRVWSEAVTLQSQGWQVSVICPKGHTSCRESYLRLENVHIYRYALPAMGNSPAAFVVEYAATLLMTFFLSLKVLLRHGFDVIHAANPPDTFFVVGLLYRLLGKKYVFDQHDLVPEMFQVKYPGRLRFLRKALLFLEGWSYRTADLVIVTNLSQKLIAMQRGRCSARKVFVVRNGPDLKRFQPVTPQPDLKGEHRYLLAYVGSMGVQDGVQYALYALHELIYKRGRRDVSLVLLGDGEHAPALRELSRELQLDDFVRFTGWVKREDILRYLTVADVGISPDPRNGLNEYLTMIKTMEYMALGVAVVAFDLAETRFSARDAALYAEPNLVGDFADKIEILLDDEELRASMGRYGRERIEADLNWGKSVEHLIEAYRSLCPEPAAGSPAIPDPETGPGREAGVLSLGM